MDWLTEMMFRIEQVREHVGDYGRHIVDYRLQGVMQEHPPFPATKEPDWGWARGLIARSINRVLPPEECHG